MALTNPLGALVAEVRELIPAISRIQDPVHQAEVARLWAQVWLESEEPRFDELAYGPDDLGGCTLLAHVNEVNDLVEVMMARATDDHGIRVDAEVARCAAILHDLDKPLLWRRRPDGSTPVLPGRTLGDHGRLGAERIRDADLPDQVADIVLGHSAFSPLLALRRSPEAVVVHVADVAAANLMHVEAGLVPPCGRGILVYQ